MKSWFMEFVGQNQADYMWWEFQKREARQKAYSKK